MESLINLGINKMEINWSKNNRITNFSSIFQEGDFEQNIPYYNVEEIDDNIYEERVIYKKGARKTLRLIKERLNLLGYDLISVENKYNEMLKEFEFYMKKQLNLTFEEFLNFIKSLDIEKINNVISSADNSENGYDLGEYFTKVLLEDEEFSSKMKEDIKKDKYFVSDFFENIEPYIILRILAENENNLDYYVYWCYSDDIESRMLTEDDVVGKLEDKNKILIVTEGKSDSFVIKKTLENLYPNICDFFEFIDMKENYPFTGTGNLVRFCQGLCKINIQNNIIILFDNDTEGLESYEKVKSIVKPDNLLICVLPICEEFDNVETVGPFGNKFVNINKKAVAIECFLDFDSVSFAPIVRWSSFNPNMKEYQGALENKDEYVRAFKSANLKDGSYNCEKLRKLIDYIIKSWIER